MKLSMSIRIVLLIGAILLSSEASAQKKWPGTVLYSLQKNVITGKFVIDPIVRIMKGEYSYPVPTPPEAFDGPNSEKILANFFDRFCREEFGKGRKLELYIGGSKVGIATVTEPDTLNSCSPVISEAKLSYTDSNSMIFKDHGLVISSIKPQKPIPTFPLSDSIMIGIYEYGKKQFADSGVKKEIVEKMQITEARATDLDGDGKPEYLVSYNITGEEVKTGEYEGNIEYSLTLVLKPSSKGFSSVFSYYPPPAVPEQARNFKFVDVLDLDGDGILEILIQQRFYSSWDYIVLKRNGNTWEKEYEGSGGGC